MSAPLLGIFVGGKASRMGFAPKGLLAAPDTGEPLVARLVRIARELAFEPVLVGEAEVYAAAFPDLRVLPDAPEGIGPLGGLRALCTAAGSGVVLAVACDMPRVSRSLLASLWEAKSDLAVVAPRGEGGFWEPLCARYDARRVLSLLDTALARGQHSLQRVLNAAGVRELSLDASRLAELTDWDTPEDVVAGGGKLRT